MSDEPKNISWRFRDVEQTTFSRNLSALDSQQMDMLIAPNESASDLLPDRARIVISALDNLDLDEDEEKSEARQAAYAELSDAEAYSVREKLAGVTELDRDLQEKLADDVHFAVRKAVAENPNFDLDLRLSLNDDPTAAVRAAAPSAAKSSDLDGDLDEEAPAAPKSDGRPSDNGMTLH